MIGSQFVARLLQEASILSLVHCEFLILADEVTPGGNPIGSVKTPQAAAKAPGSNKSPWVTSSAVRTWRLNIQIQRPRITVHTPSAPTGKARVMASSRTTGRFVHTLPDL
jgi:hypothetical protein